MKTNNKIFIIDSTGGTPTISGDVCPVMANLIEACESDNRIELNSGDTTFNKTIIAPYISIGNISEFDGTNDFYGKILLGNNTGFSLTNLSLFTGSSNTYSSNDNSVTITLSGDNVDFSVNVVSATTYSSDDNSLFITPSNDNVDFSVITTDIILSGGTIPITNGAVYDGLLTKQNIPTGFIIGLELSVNPFDNTKVDIAPGAYSVTDYSDLFNVDVKIIQLPNGITGITPQFLTASTASYLALDMDMNVVQSASPFDNADRRTLAIIGAAIHSNLSFVNTTNEIKAPVIAPANQLHDFIRAIGALNLTGNLYSPNGNNLMIDKSSGQLWGLGINGGNYLDPHRLTISAQTAVTFRYRLKDSSESGDTQNIDPNNYDVDGVLTPVPTGKFTIQHINLFQSGLSRIQYGQHVYDTMNEAKSLLQIESFDTEMNIAENSVFRAYLIIKEGITDLELGESNDEVAFIPVDKFGNVIGGAGFSLNFNDVIVALGYTPENVVNKVTNFSSPNNVTYPTTSAVTNTFIPKDNGTTYNTNFIKTMTQAEYNAISGSTNSGTLYFII